MSTTKTTSKITGKPLKAFITPRCNQAISQTMTTTSRPSGDRHHAINMFSNLTQQEGLPSVAQLNKQIDDQPACGLVDAKSMILATLAKSCNTDLEWSKLLIQGDMLTTKNLAISMTQSLYERLLVGIPFRFIINEQGNLWLERMTPDQLNDMLEDAHPVTPPNTHTKSSSKSNKRVKPSQPAMTREEYNNVLKYHKQHPIHPSCLASQQEDVKFCSCEVLKAGDKLLAETRVQTQQQQLAQAKAAQSNEMHYSSGHTKNMSSYFASRDLSHVSI